MLLALIPALGLGLSTASAKTSQSPSESYHESLTLHPRPDGKLSVSFDFTTYFSSPPNQDEGIGHHNALTPPSLLLPLANNGVSEMSISFVAGKWDQKRSGEMGPLEVEAGGGGGEIRGWLKDGWDSDERWTAITHALGGLFCAGLGPDAEESIKTFGHIYPPETNIATNLTHRLMSTPYLPLCTENLTPFLSLLPSKGLSGLSTLLAQPNIVFSWGFKTEGIEVIMPSLENGGEGRWRGWWEGVVDLVPEKQGGGSRSFSLGSLFKRGVPRPFPEASTSVLRLIKSGGEEVSVEPDNEEVVWMDGKEREVVEWDLLGERVQSKDIKVDWVNEEVFRYPRTITPPPIVVARTVTSPRAMDGIFTTTITNNSPTSQRATYSEIWPWWVKGWISELEVKVKSNGNGNGTLDQSVNKQELITHLAYHPSTPPKPTTTTLHLSLILPADSTIVMTIPFTKLMLKYTEHRPDAERGREISSGILTLFNDDYDADMGYRNRIYTPRLLLDVPTPDFSMPYNVIIMSSTVMAVFFGLMHGSLTRRWGWVELPDAKGESGELRKKECKGIEK